MRRDPCAFLWDAHRAARAIVEFTRSKTFEEFTGDLLVRSAVERQFEIIGEALTQLAKIDPKLAAKVPERPHIVAFRNILIHDYDVIDHANVWRMIHENLPALERTLKALLGPEPRNPRKGARRPGERKKK
jgi:uncharacterized protein with HEPN domain